MRKPCFTCVRAYVEDVCPVDNITEYTIFGARSFMYERTLEVSGECVTRWQTVSPTVAYARVRYSLKSIIANNYDKKNMKGGRVLRNLQDVVKDDIRPLR